MCRFAVVALLALITQGCTKKPQSYALTSKPGNYPLTAFRSDYQNLELPAAR